MKLYIILFLSLALCNITIAQNFRGSSAMDSIGASSASRKLADSSNNDAASILAGLEAATNNNQPATQNTSNEDNEAEGLSIEIPTDNTNQNSSNNSTDNTEQIDSTNSDGFTPVDLDQAHSDSVFMSNFDFGLNYVLALGIQSTLLKDRDYNVSQVYNVYQQPADNNGINYKVDLQLQDEGGVVVNITFITNHQASSYSREVLAFTYRYEYLNSQNILLDVKVDWTLESGNYTATITQIADLNSPSNTDSTPSVETLDLAGYLAVGGYNNIPVDSVNSNEILTNLMLYGVQGVVQEGKENGLLDTNDAYNLVQIFSIYGQQSSDGKIFLFRFEVGIDNGSGFTARVNYEVYYDTSAEGPSLWSHAINSIQNV